MPGNLCVVVSTMVRNFMCDVNSYKLNNGVRLPGERVWVDKTDYDATLCYHGYNTIKTETIDMALKCARYFSKRNGFFLFHYPPVIY